MKILFSIYTVLTSLLIFGLILNIGKGFDLIHYLDNTVGFIVLILLLVATFLELGFGFFGMTSKKEKHAGVNFDEETKEPSGEKDELVLDSYTIDKSLIKEHLKSVSGVSSESASLDIVVEETEIKTVIEVLNIEEFQVGEVITELEDKFANSLKNKFHIKKDIKLSFEVKNKKIEE